MAHKSPKATLASSKGGSLLAELKKKMAPDLSAASSKADRAARWPTVEDELKAKLARKGELPTRKAPAATREKGQQYIKIADPQLRREVIAEVKKIGVSKSASLPSSECRSDLGQQEFNKLARMRSEFEGFSATYHGGDTQDPPDHDLIAGRIAVGARKIGDVADPTDGFFLGYDFGTSTTKAIARYPYGGIDDAFAIHVPRGIAVQPHLWPTALWFDRASGTFSLPPVPDAICLGSFKEALIEGKGQRICARSGVTMAEAAVAYLALHFAYCVGSAIDQHAKFKLAGINVGVPVATLKLTPTVSLYERVVDAALFLIPFAETLTLRDVKSALETPDRGAISATLHTELAGAIAGYCAMPRPYVGGHMIIDCGSATLDMASFALDGVSLKPITIHEARVEHLGADACAAYQRLGASIVECRKAARHLEHLVFARTLQFDHHRFAQTEGAFPYQVILVGGGIHSEVHAPLFQTMETAFHRAFHRPELPPGLRYERGCEAGRLILADGLARDPIELREVAMPGDPPTRRDCLPEMITKDQM